MFLQKFAIIVKWKNALRQSPCIQDLLGKFTSIQKYPLSGQLWNTTDSYQLCCHGKKTVLKIIRSGF